MKLSTFFTHYTWSRFGHASTLCIFLLICVFSLSSCYHYRVAATGDPDSSTLVQKKTQVVYLWGFIQAKDIKANCNGIHKVRVSTNAWFILISVITAGIVVPQKVEWMCAAETPPADTLSISYPKQKNLRDAK